MPKKEQTDKQLVELANEGDERAMEELYLRHRDWVVSLAWRFLGSRDDALDVMQAVFEELIGRFPGFLLRSTMRAYLYPVVKHRSISLLRKRRKVVPLKEDKESQNLLNWHPPPAGDFERLIRALSDDHKEVIYLRFGLGMTMEEIGQFLGLPLGTVKSRLHNALKKLRKTQS